MSHKTTTAPHDRDASPPPRPTPCHARRPLPGRLPSRVLLTSLACILFAASALAQDAPPREDPRSAAKLVTEGNKLLAGGNYAEALAAYDRAAELLPDSPEVAYNRGVALYRMEAYAQAEPALQNALRPGNPELEANAKYNLGRCAHAAALKQQENPEAAINDLSRAIRFYQDALQIAPEDPDASKNLGLAARLKTFLERRLEQQEQQQPSSQPTSQPDQQPTSQPTSQPQQGDQEQDQQGESEQQQNQQDEHRPDQDAEQDEKGEGQKKQEPSEQDPAEDEEQREMTPEQAEKFLQEARDKERERREEKRRQAMRIRGRIPVEKDW